jgi:hypothetical protein
VSASDAAAYRACLAALRRRGLLLASAADLPNVAEICAGEPVAGSWWGHPAGKRIFATMTRLLADDDVASMKLVSGKVTYVHRGLWADLHCVALSGDKWQMEFLPAREARLLERVDAEGVVRLDDAEVAAAETDGRELEARLLVVGGSEHSASGNHERVLASWPTWARGRDVAPAADAPAAYARLDAAAKSLGPRARLPWWPRPPRKRR